MRRARSMALVSVLAATLVWAGQAATTIAAPVSFGAALDNFSQPSNAESGKRCSDEISSAESCTWVALSAYHNGSHFRAPVSGTIGTVRLVSCIAGSFILQIATPGAASHTARVLRNGPTINYRKDPSAVCGGDNGDAYVVQSFAVTVPILKGDLIGIYASKVGPLYCSGGSGVDLYSPPLGATSAFKPRKDSTSCDLMIQLVYK
jgi:hypothetical protein